MRDALATTKNSIKAAVIDAIESGEMHIFRNVSDEMKDLYPDLYEQFKSIKSRKYLKISVAATAAASSIAEDYGASLLGSIPTIESFENIAAVLQAGAALVSSGKAYSDCASIVKKCGLDSNCVVPIGAFG
jgi:hypothetical protein